MGRLEKVIDICPSKDDAEGPLEHELATPKATPSGVTSVQEGMVAKGVHESMQLVH